MSGVLYRCKNLTCGSRVSNLDSLCEKCRSKSHKQKREKRKQNIYSSERWRNIAAQSKLEQPFCQWINRDLSRCTYPVDETDHMIPYEQVPGAPIYDPQYLQSLCRTHHGLKTSREVGRQRPDIFVISGPPCSGKTTLCRTLMRPGEIFFDFDELKKALLGGSIYPCYTVHPHVLDYLLAVRRAALDNLHTIKGCSRAWIIDSAPLAEARNAYRDSVNAVTIVLEVEPSICKTRMDSRDPGDTYQMQPLIDKWWSAYRAAPGDLVLTAQSIAQVLDAHRKPIF